MTAGPTYEPIDPVRFIGNHSSGKMGFALAETLAEKGAEVILVSGPVQLSPANSSVKRIDVMTAEQMYEACIKVFSDMDGAILSAAVADYRPVAPSNTKIKKTGNDELVIRLEKNKDILAELGRIKKDGQVLAGFSLETHNEQEFALDKLKRKNCDFIVLNSLNTKGAGFGVDTNQVIIFGSKGEKQSSGLKSKKEVAEDIIDFMIKNYL